MQGRGIPDLQILPTGLHCSMLPRHFECAPKTISQVVLMVLRLG